MNAPLGVGTFLVWAAALLLAAAPPPRSPFWIGEVEGVSMSPLLNGERKTFPCTSCGRQLCFDLEKTERDALLRCAACDQWQVLPKAAKALPADKVLVRSAAAPQLQRGDVVVIEHPRLGLVIKRVAGVPGDFARITPEGTYVGGKSFGVQPASSVISDIQRLIEANSEATPSQLKARAQEQIEIRNQNLTVPSPSRSLTLKQGEYFVLGDDLENSCDSREEAFGVVLAPQIVGKVVGTLPRSGAGGLQTASISKAK